MSADVVAAYVRGINPVIATHVWIVDTIPARIPNMMTGKSKNLNEVTISPQYVVTRRDVSLTLDALKHLATNDCRKWWNILSWM